MALQSELGFISIPEIVARSSLSRGTVYNMIDRGELPRTVRLTANRVGLPRAPVEAWFAARAAQLEAA